MSNLVWGGNIHYWFGPNTNRPVPTVRLTGKQNLAALLQVSGVHRGRTMRTSVARRYV